MSHIDIKYKKLVETILKDGKETFDTSRDIKTITIPSYTLKVRTRPTDLSLITTKKINFNNIVTELLFFIKGYSNIKYLVQNDCNIWNKDAYNHYLNSCNKVNHTTKLTFKEFYTFIKDNSEVPPAYMPKGYVLGELGPVYGVQWNRGQQLINVITNLIKGNWNRRLIVNAWNPEELKDMALPPCHWSFELLPLGQTLHLKWHQRSVDTFLGLPYNIASYSLLMDILTDISSLKNGELIGDLSNVHIYENHLSAVNKQLENSCYQFKSPTVSKTDEYWELLADLWMDKITLKDFFNKLNPSMFILNDYKSYGSIVAEMLAPKVK